ncbi:MAG: MurR/RpiR family transcriptional regulator [Agathobacter sp.]|nr:MurR/RpiR family transcriptional regulator [Agathobacter sp.]
MNVLQSLIELSNSQSLDNIYRDIANQILGNLDQMKRVTIYDLADMTHSSRTTIWRLVQKLGYKSFSDFRHALQSASSQYTYYNRLVPSNTASSQHLLSHIEGELHKAAEVISDKLNISAIDEMVDELMGAGKIHFYMPYRLAVIYSFQINLSKCGKETSYICLIPDMLEEIETLDENSIVFINTIEYAETLDMEEVFIKLKEKGVRIWLSGESESQYISYADRHILDVSLSPSSWLFTYEALIIALSERLRGRHINRK